MRIMNEKEKEYVTLVQPKFKLGCQEMSTKGRSCIARAYPANRTQFNWCLSNVLMVTEKTLCHQGELAPTTATLK